MMSKKDQRPNTKSEQIDLISSAEQTSERSEMSSESTKWTKFTSESMIYIDNELVQETSK